jgi:trk system potassium uptake protein TrkH
MHKHLAPGRLIALGFASVILLGALLLALPLSQRQGVPFLDALFTSTSAVCVTGLVTVDPGDSFTVFGRVVLALLIQVGGLGVTSIGVGFMLLSGRKIDFRARNLAKEGLNYNSLKGILALVRAVLVTTLSFELVGALFSLPSFLRRFPPLKAIGISMFHSVAAFNNAGFDVLGGFRSLSDYRGDVLLCLTTALLVIFGGLGFCVIRELWHRRPGRRGLTLHTRVVLWVTGILLAVGTLLIKATDRVTWLEAFFLSASARTAGFSVVDLSRFSGAGLLTLCVLMFIGASPGSTGGGIKTTTTFVMFRAVLGASTNTHPLAFKRRLPRELVYKAFVITVLAVSVVLTSTFLLCVLEPDHSFEHLLFEAVSAFGTVGLSAGVTPTLGAAAKLVLILTMFIGRLGPLTVASLWVFRPATDVAYVEESVTIG